MFSTSLSIASEMNFRAADSCKKLPGEVVRVYRTKEFRLDKVHISVHILRRVAAGISSSLCIKVKRHSFGQFHSLTYINRWCWLLHK